MAQNPSCRGGEGVPTALELSHRIFELSQVSLIVSGVHSPSEFLHLPAGTLSLRSLDEVGELLQWLCHGVSTV